MMSKEGEAFANRNLCGNFKVFAQMLCPYISITYLQIKFILSITKTP